MSTTANAQGRRTQEMVPGHRAADERCRRRLLPSSWNGRRPGDDHHHLDRRFMPVVWPLRPLTDSNLAESRRSVAATPLRDGRLGVICCMSTARASLLIGFVVVFASGRWGFCSFVCRLFRQGRRLDHRLMDILWLPCHSISHCHRSAVRPSLENTMIAVGVECPAMLVYAPSCCPCVSAITSTPHA